MTRDELIREVESWIDTPFHHQGRLKGVGVDCIGLLVSVARNMGNPVEDVYGYSIHPRDFEMLNNMNRQLKRVVGEPQPGDILLFKFNKYPQHVAVMVEDGYMIHALDPVGRVVKHRFDETWRKRMIGSFEFPGVE